MRENIKSQMKLRKVAKLFIQCKQKIIDIFLIARALLRKNILVFCQRIKGLRNKFSINEEMARHGILLLTFGFILFSVVPNNEVRVFPFIPSPPEDFSIVLRIILTILSFIVIFVISWIWLKYRLINGSKGKIKTRIYSVILFILILSISLLTVWLAPSVNFLFTTISGLIILLTSIAFMAAIFLKWLAVKLNWFLHGRGRSIYWLIFWIVSTISWLKGISGIPTAIYFHDVILNLASMVCVLWFFVIGFIYLNASRHGKAN